MTKKTGGGSATNSGIDYQQRVAAFFQIFLYTQLEVSQVLSEDFPLTVKSLHYETADAIDDLSLACEKDHTLYLQVKRAITFSDSPDSEFIKTLDQFIVQYGKGGIKNYYLLITSSDSSRRVTGELRKILSSIRLNDDTFKLNPLNKSEKDVYAKFKAAFIARTFLFTQQIPNDQDLVDFAKRVYVEIMDVEAGMSLEKSAKLLLLGHVQNPELVWALLIKNSLIYASSRASINRQALVKILSNHKIQKKEAIDEGDFDALLRDSVTLNGEYSYNKEVLIIESENGDSNQIMEIARFTDTCSKSLSFSNNEVRFGDDPLSLKVIFRGSSGVGLSRFIKQNPTALGDKTLEIFDMPPIESAGQEECISLYSKYLDRLSKENRNLGNCLHCGKPVGRLENLLIEIDDNDTPAAVGACHLICRRPMDRVLGTARVEHDGLSPFLEDFDLKDWVSLSLKGGILTSGLTPGLQGRAGIAWSGFQHLGEGDYCVKFQMEDGTKRFGFHRGKIERLTEQEAIQHAAEFNLKMKLQKDDNDPIGFTTKNFSYGIYSKLLIGMEADDEFVAITGAEAVRYSQQEAKLHESGRMYYAPLCYVANKADGSIMNISNMIPLVSEPRKIDTLAKSWKRAGIDVEGLMLKTLRSDNQVDAFFAKLFGDEMLPVIDPVLDHRGQLVTGFPVKPAQDFLTEDSDENETELTRPMRPVADPFWHKGEFVEVDFPDGTGDEQRMYGRLVYDEAETGEGKRIVVFQPIEEGIPVKDVHLVIPSMFVSKWNGRDIDL